MSINKNIKLVYVILALYGINGAKRISELECEKSSKFQVDERSLDPHMMVILYRTNFICFATLISKNFMLSSEKCANFIKFFGSSNIDVRKSKLIGKEYPESHRFTINSIISHERNEIALIKFNEVFPSVLKNTSIFQPACLWTQQILPSTYTYTIYTSQSSNSSVRIISGNIIIDENCIGILELSDYYSNSYICVNTSELLNPSIIGSPIGVHVGNRNYIIGVVNDGYNFNNFSILLGTKISSSISWIELDVWPNYPDPVSQFVCGQRKVTHKPLTSYGLSTYEGRFPWLVALFRVEGGRQKIHKYICSGIIIDYQTVLTVANCVVDERGVIPPYRLVIMAGTQNLEEYSNSTRYYSVNKITIHEEFNLEYIGNDIALIKLNYPMEFSNYIQAVCISHNLNFGTNTTMIGTVIGWGKSASDQPSNELLQATFLINNNVCRYAYLLNEGNYCAEYQNGTHACSRDSGGAMIIQYKSRWYIRGIVSTGATLPNSNECNLNHTVLFTDVPKFYNWIVKNLLL